MNFYKDRVCLNVLAGGHENAKEVYAAAEKYVLVGVLSADYATIEEAVSDMQVYNTELEGNLSVGLGGGNPNQWFAVSSIAKEVKCSHYNQIFSAVGHTRCNVDNETGHINALVSPSGVPGLVKISTGPLSKDAEAALVPIDTAIKMIKEMGGNSVKFFPMKGLACKDELIAVSKACSANDFVLEPTGGIDLDNYREILETILNEGVKKVIPHVYSSIIDKETKQTRVEDVKKLLEITKEIVG